MEKSKILCPQVTECPARVMFFLHRDTPLWTPRNGWHHWHEIPVCIVSLRRGISWLLILQKLHSILRCHQSGYEKSCRLRVVPFCPLSGMNNAREKKQYRSCDACCPITFATGLLSTTSSPLFSTLAQSSASQPATLITSIWHFALGGGKWRTCVRPVEP